ncbi:response regulator [Undibacterium sp. CY18W]|uniref:Response regulator n=1 Tax=Undibacterium hunanense TaxID=2762292 RepID=A0ABR6ZM95_9BURK|nr:response regulator [Undibacterium hunanense]MBC3917017.1 response regulator [Undibacterium hunanense]
MDSGTRILIVEDDLKIAALLKDYLLAAGYQVSHEANGRLALEQLRLSQPDLILLDLMLPEVDGISICREVRQFSQVPIIMLTARVEEVDRLLGLDTGADDYVCKPFSPREVVARVRVHLRRSMASLSAAGQSRFFIDKQQLRILVDAQPLNLTPVEFRLLSEFISHPERVFSRQQLLDFAHEDQRDINDRTVDTHIKNIRKKIQGRLPGNECLHSVYGVGYRFELP